MRLGWKIICRNLKLKLHAEQKSRAPLDASYHENRQEVRFSGGSGS